MIKPFAIVFDLGNVLLPIDLDKTYVAFASFSSLYTAAEIKQITLAESLWVPYESGLLSDVEFENLLINRFQLVCNTDQFRSAFNALLLPIDEALVKYIRELGLIFPLYLLSNTSSLHSKLFLNLAYPNYHLFEVFKQVHLSFEMGMVKPNTMIYKQLIDVNQLHDHQIVFFDDNLLNVEAAGKLGWQAFLIDPKRAFQQIKEQISLLC
jgi:FMN phosphatase YigB (HAD superfamily)